MRWLEPVSFTVGIFRQEMTGDTEPGERVGNLRVKPLVACSDTIRDYSDRLKHILDFAWLCQDSILYYTILYWNPHKTNFDVTSRLYSTIFTHTRLANNLCRPFYLLRLVSFHGRPCFVNFNDGDPVADGLKDIRANLKSAERQQFNICGWHDHIWENRHQTNLKILSYPTSMPSPFSVREVVVVWAAGGIHFVPIPRKGWWGWWGGGTWCRVVIWYPKHLDGKTLVVPSASYFDLEHFFNAPAALARRMLGLVLRHWKNFPDSEKTFPVDPSGMFGETPRMF